MGCTALRAYTCNLRLKCIRNKKMVSRLNKMRLQTYPAIKKPNLSTSSPASNANALTGKPRKTSVIYMETYEKNESKNISPPYPINPKTEEQFVVAKSSLNEWKEIAQTNVTEEHLVIENMNSPLQTTRKRTKETENY